MGHTGTGEEPLVLYVNVQVVQISGATKLAMVSDWLSTSIGVMILAWSLVSTADDIL